MRRVNKLFTLLATVCPQLRGVSTARCAAGYEGDKVAPHNDRMRVRFTASRCWAASGCEMRHGATWEARVKVHRPAPLGLNAEGSQCLKGFLDGKLRMLAHGALDRSALICRQCREYFAARIA